MGVYKDRNSPFWWISYTDANGRRHRESTKTSIKEEAKKIHAAKVTGAKQPHSKNTVSQLLNGLLYDYRVNGKSINWAEIVVEKHLRPYFGKKKATSLSKADLNAYAQFRRAKGIANSTINREISLLRRSFTLGETGFPKFQKFAENNIRTGFLTDEEFAKLVRASPEHLQGIVMFAYTTGCRLSEILGLRWDQLDLDGRVIRLHPSETKNRTGRTIPLSKQICDMFRNSKRECPERIFSYRGAPIRSIYAGFRSAVERAGLSNVHFHDLRRCAIRNLSRAGTVEAVAMAISGHKTRSVFDRYNIVSESDLHDAMNKREKTLTKAEQAVSGLFGPSLDKYLE